MKDIKFAGLFGNNPDISLEEKTRVIGELQKIGSLTFLITVSEEGWIAECQEIDGLFAADKNPKATSLEIDSQIREAVYNAFNVKFNKIPVSVPQKFEYAVC